MNPQLMKLKKMLSHPALRTLWFYVDTQTVRVYMGLLSLCIIPVTIFFYQSYLVLAIMIFETLFCLINPTSSFNLFMSRYAMLNIMIGFLIAFALGGHMMLVALSALFAFLLAHQMGLWYRAFRHNNKKGLDAYLSDCIDTALI